MPRPPLYTLTKACRLTPADALHLLKDFDAQDASEEQQVHARMLLLADGGDSGLPIIQDIPSEGSEHVGFGLFRAKTDEYDVEFDGGGAMCRTPLTNTGFCWAIAKRGHDALAGRIGYRRNKVREHLVRIAEGEVLGAE